MPGGDPIDAITWVPAASLRANAYNPNFVMDIELKLLETSLLETGWVHPLVVSRTGVIIDGFHRWRLAQDSAALRARYSAMVPVARVDVSDDEAMALTIRMNRARGVHAAMRMSAVVRTLVDTHGWGTGDLMRRLGLTQDEAAVLYKDLFRHRKLKDHVYSRAWVPEEIQPGVPVERVAVERSED